MTRTCLAFIFVLVALPIAARADDAPTQEQIEQAKTAYIEGKALHDAGKLVEAVDKFKESYRLSKNPLLLYNIGFTLDESGQKDLALFYYRKFLSDAPQNAAQRGTVDKRVKELEKEKLEADLNGKAPDANDPFGTGNKPSEPQKPAEPTKKIKIKPAGTYGADSFQHQIVEEAPPHKPLDITAFVPEDSGFSVALYYRISGEATFTAKLMRWRYKELVARVPANKLSGSAIQYYIVVKDQNGKEIARSGKQASPNLVTVDEKAPEHFYPDFSDDGGPPKSSAQQKQEDVDEDPLHPRQKKVSEAEERHEEALVPTTPGNGFVDVGSKKFFYTKWGATAGAAVFLGLGLTFAALAGNEANQLLQDSKTAPGGAGPCSAPPCRPFDSYDKALQDAGKRDALIAQVSITASVLAGGVAAYYWVKELRAKKRHELKVGKNNASPETTWVVVPSIGQSFAGAAAAARF